MIRYAFAASIVVVTTAAACGAFEAEDNPVGTPDGGVATGDAGGTGESGASGDGSTTANDGGSCVTSSVKDDFEDAVLLGPQWTGIVVVADAGLDASNDAGTLFIDLSKDVGTQRGYLQFNHPATPCSGLWSYALKFQARVKADKRIAGPRLGGVYVSADAGSDTFQNHVELGFAFETDKAYVAFTDDACKPGPGSAECLDGGPGNGSAFSTKIAPDWHSYEIRITPFATPDPVLAYGKVLLVVDKEEKEFGLDYPMRDMKLETYGGVSLSSAEADGFLEIAELEAVLTAL